MLPVVSRHPYAPPPAPLRPGPPIPLFPGDPPYRYGRPQESIPEPPPPWWNWIFHHGLPHQLTPYERGFWPVQGAGYYVPPESAGGWGRAGYGYGGGAGYAFGQDPASGGPGVQGLGGVTDMWELPAPGDYMQWNGPPPSRAALGRALAGRRTV